MVNEHKNILEKEHLKILVHTASLFTDTTAMVCFKLLSNYGQFSVYYLPIEVLERVTGNRIGQYKHIKEKHIIYSTIRFSDCSSCIGTHHEVNGIVFTELSESDLD